MKEHISRDVTICDSCEFKKKYIPEKKDEPWTPEKFYRLVKCEKCDICYNYPEQFEKRSIDFDCPYYDAQLLSQMTKNQQNVCQTI